MVVMHVWFIGLKGHFGEIAGKNKVRPLFLLFSFFRLVRILGKGFGVQYFGIFGLGGPGTLGHLEFLNVGSWLTHHDLALEVVVGFL